MAPQGSNQPQTTVENTFIKGLQTEFTGLNFPEHACTETQNCVFEVTGRVHRRAGIDFESPFSLSAQVDRTNLAINTYKWNNVGGDGNTQIVVTQVGKTLTFYRSSTATNAAPLSLQVVGTPIDVSTFVPMSGGATFDATIECQFTDGNGYLFVFHPTCDPFFVQYDPNGPLLTAQAINIQIRDFRGVFEPGVIDNFRPPTLSNEHKYNLYNQGWSSSSPTWTASSGTTFSTAPGTHTWTVQTGLTGIAGGQQVSIVIITVQYGQWLPFTALGTVNSYNSVSGALNVTVTSSSGTATGISWTFTFGGTDRTGAFFTASGVYPSNADVWWLYKDTTGVYNPSSTFGNVTLDTGPAPKGHFLLNAFNQAQTTISGISTVTNVSTNTRPKTGAFFQGRIFFSGVDAAFQATGDAQYTTWTENIYFSQVIEREIQFGYCYQTNDPTSEDKFDLLPTDGGVIVIQGSGSIYRLFPVQNGMLVFAANGIWFITGSTGIGFTANDYTITKISSVRTVSSTSFVDVNGWPMFWNEEGIYNVTPGQTGGLTVNLITYRSIASFYDAIPLPSRKYARGTYNPLTYTVQWVYKVTQETGVTDRYNFDGILNYNVGSEAWFPWTVSTAVNFPYIHGINYVSGPGGTSTPAPTNKYFCSFFNVNFSQDQFTFAEERDETFWADWKSVATLPLFFSGAILNPVAGTLGSDTLLTVGTIVKDGFAHTATVTSRGIVGGGFTFFYGMSNNTLQGTSFSLSNDPLNYVSDFVSGFRLHGSAVKDFQPEYVLIFSGNTSPARYKFQGLWNYAKDKSTGKFTTVQIAQINSTKYNDFFRRFRCRGQGLAFQIKVASVDGYPFDIIGWSTWETESSNP